MVVTYFISGHRNITEEEFNKNYAEQLSFIKEHMKKGYYKFVIGDYNGVDIMAQNYLIDNLNIDPEHITIYHMFDSPRNCHPKIKNLVGGFKSDEERDSAMTKNSDLDIAFVRDHNKWSGTAANILRRKLLK